LKLLVVIAIIAILLRRLIPARPWASAQGEGAAKCNASTTTSRPRFWRCTCMPGTNRDFLFRTQIGPRPWDFFRNGNASSRMVIPSGWQRPRPPNPVHCALQSESATGPTKAGLPVAFSSRTHRSIDGPMDKTTSPSFRQAHQTNCPPTWSTGRRGAVMVRFGANQLQGGPIFDPDAFVHVGARTTPSPHARGPITLQ